MIIYYIIASVAFTVSCYVVNNLFTPNLQEYLVQMTDKFP